MSNGLARRGAGLYNLQAVTGLNIGWRGGDSIEVAVPHGC